MLNNINKKYLMLGGIVLGAVVIIVLILVIISATKGGKVTYKDIENQMYKASINYYKKHEKDLPVLKGMNFKVNANETIGFVGPSGAGKSTIFNLISAIERVDKGLITFDGVDINTLDKSSIRGNLSVISQNAYIFNMSILDNLKVIKKMLLKKRLKMPVT